MAAFKSLAAQLAAKYQSAPAKSELNICPVYHLVEQRRRSPSLGWLLGLLLARHAEKLADDSSGRTDCPGGGSGEPDHYPIGGGLDAHARRSLADSAPPHAAEESFRAHTV